jgi:hypothetical protein
MVFVYALSYMTSVLIFTLTPVKFKKKYNSYGELLLLIFKCEHK